MTDDPKELFRCSECKREPREDENPDDEWRAASEGVGELHHLPGVLGAGVRREHRSWALIARLDAAIRVVGLSATSPRRAHHPWGGDAHGESCYNGLGSLPVDTVVATPVESPRGHLI